MGLTPGRKLYEGKWKILFETGDPARLLQRFKDVPAFDRGVRRVPGRGAMKNRIAARLFEVLHASGVPTHYLEMTGERDMAVRRLEMIRLEVVLRNVVAGSLTKRLGMEEGTPLPLPVLELYYKSDALGDPLVNETHVAALGLASSKELKTIRDMTFRANAILLPFFTEREIQLVDLKLEFGRLAGQVLIGDDITPDGCRFWDQATRARLGKDRRYRSAAREAAAYAETCRRVCA